MNPEYVGDRPKRQFRPKSSTYRHSSRIKQAATQVCTICSANGCNTTTCLQKNDKIRVAMMIAEILQFYALDPDERALHEINHLPYAAWCEVCSMAKCRPESRRSDPKPFYSEGIFCCEFCFFHSQAVIAQTCLPSVKSLHHMKTSLYGICLIVRRGVLSQSQLAN